MSSDEVVEVLGMSKQYYDFSQQGWRFVALDTNDISLYANAPGSPKYQQAQTVNEVLKWAGRDNAQTWNGGVGSEQMAWLQGVLADARSKNQKVVVFGHMPVYPMNQHNVWNDDAIIKVLESSNNVVAYFNGHNHAGNYGQKAGIHYVNLHGMVELDSNAYSTVRVYDNRLEVNGYGREPDRTLKISKGI